jgi:hypothetical protein
MTQEASTNQQYINVSTKFSMFRVSVPRRARIRYCVLTKQF